MRTGAYAEEWWKTATGQTVQELGEAWKADLEQRLGNPVVDAK